MADVLDRPAARYRAASDAARTLHQLRYAHRDFLRNPVMAFVTLGFPLMFLIMLGLASRDAPPDPVTGAGAIQATAPVAAVFATVMATYVMMPFGISRARERGVLKRLRGTPLPMWSYLAGRVGSALSVALAGTVVMLAVAGLAFGLDMPWAQVPAMLATFAVGVVSFAALGFALAVVLRNSTAVLTFTMGSFFLIAFVSGVFAPDLALPRVLDVIGWVFPLRHFATSFGGTFDPTTAGLAWTHLAAMAGWGIAGAVVGVRRVSWAPARDVRTVGRLRRQRATGRQPRRGMWWQQVRYANRAVWRDPAAAFFVIAFPVLFVVVVPYAFGRPVIDGVDLARIMTPAMAVFAIAVAAYVNAPEAVAIQRDQRILKRLRGTPLPAAAYLTGRLGSVLWIAALGFIGVFLAGWAVHGVATRPSTWPLLAVVFVVGTAALAAVGFAIVALTPDAKAVPAIGLGTFIPLAFISDLLAFGIDLPDVLQRIGWVFPFKHLVHALETAFTGTGLAWGHLGVVALWGTAGAAVSVVRFRWEPRAG